MKYVKLHHITSTHSIALNLFAKLFIPQPSILIGSNFFSKNLSDAIYQHKQKKMFMQAGKWKVNCGLCNNFSIKVIRCYKLLHNSGFFTKSPKRLTVAISQQV